MFYHCLWNALIEAISPNNAVGVLKILQNLKSAYSDVNFQLLDLEELVSILLTLAGFEFNWIILCHFYFILKLI